MLIVSLKSGNDKETRRIELSDGSLFSFKTCYLPPEILNDNLCTPGTADGCEIDTAHEEGFRFASECLRAEKAALRLIARAEQCSLGLARKLEHRGHRAACINTVLSHLSELKFIDDGRFARFWLESRLRLARSPRRMLIALCGRGINRDDAQAAINAVLDEKTEADILSRYVKKRKLARKKHAHEDSGLRQLKFELKSEGFSSHAIQSFFDAL